MAIGVVVVGSGLIARFHAQAVNASDKLVLKGFCDTFSLEGARRAAAEFGGEAWGDFDAALSSEGVGMVTVATASGAHDEAVFAAARHKLPVLSEKPLAITVARIDAMIAACKEAGVPLGCILQTRFSPLFEEAKRKVESGELGKITYAAIRIPWWRDDEYYTNLCGDVVLPRARQDAGDHGHEGDACHRRRQRQVAPGRIRVCRA